MIENNRLRFTAQLADGAKSARKVAQGTLQAGVTRGFALQGVFQLTRRKTAEKLRVASEGCTHKISPGWRDAD